MRRRRDVHGQLRQPGDRGKRGQRGSVAVEFALIMPIFCVLIFGVIQYGWYFYAMQSGTSAVGDTLRRLSVGACQTQSVRDTYLKNDLGAALSGSIASDAVSYKDTGGTTSATPVQGGSVTLTVTFPTLNLHFPFIPLPGGGSVTRAQTARVEDATAAAGVTCS